MAGGSKSQQESSSKSGTFVDPRQIPFLDFLQQQGQQLAGSQLSSIGDVASQLTGTLGGQGSQLLGSLLSQSQQQGPGVGQAISGLLNFSGQSSLDFQSLLEPGAHLPGALSALDESIQRNLASTLGTIGGQATLQGQTGGDRQAFFSGQAAGDAQRAFGAGASALLGSDLASRRALGPAVAGLDVAGRQQELQALGQAGGLGLQQQGLNIGAAGSGIDALAPLFNLGLGGFSAEFGPLLALAQIIGQPTVLGASSATGSGSSQGFSILGFGSDD